MLQGIMMFRQAVFLLSNKKHFSYDDFAKVNHGDIFSKKLQNDLDILIKEGFVEKKVESGPYTRMYSFIVSEKSNPHFKNIDCDSINLFLEDIRKYVENSKVFVESNSFEYYEKVSEKLNYEVNLLMDTYSKSCLKYEWNPSFLSSKNRESSGLYYISWFPLGPVHFKNIQRDIKRQAPCTFEQRVLNTKSNLCEIGQNKEYSVYSSKVTNFVGYNKSQILQTEELHIEYVISSVHGDIGTELHRDGTIIFGISEKVISEEIREEFKKICTDHIFSIMSEIQLDMMISSKGSGIQKSLNPLGNMFSIFENDSFENLPGNSKSYNGSELKHFQSVLCINQNAPDLVKGLVVYRMLLRSIDDFVSDIFNVIWVIWRYDLEKLNTELLGYTSANRLKSIREKTAKINKDFIDMNLIIEYLSDVIEKRTKEVYLLEEKNLNTTEIISTSRLLEWKISDLRRILISSVDYHKKINELITARYEEIISKYEEDKNNSLAVLNFILFGVFVYPIIVDVIPKLGVASHIILTVFVCIIGYGIFKTSMYLYSKYS